MTSKEIISSEQAPQAVGPYSHAVRVGNLLYTSGQIALNPETMELVEGGVAAQTEQVLKNLGAVLASAGSSYEQVIKTTVFLRFIKDYAAVNEVYARFFGESKPARSAVSVAALPLQALVEIEAVAYVPTAKAKEADQLPELTNEEKPKKKQKDKKKKDKKKKK